MLVERVPGRCEGGMFIDEEGGVNDVRCEEALPAMAGGMYTGRTIFAPTSPRGDAGVPARLCSSLACIGEEKMRGSMADKARPEEELPPATDGVHRGRAISASTSADADVPTWFCFRSARMVEEKMFGSVDVVCFRSGPAARESRLCRFRQFDPNASGRKILSCSR